jgi:hypothetical protein
MAGISETRIKTVPITAIPVGELDQLERPTKLELLERVPITKSPGASPHVITYPLGITAINERIDSHIIVSQDHPMDGVRILLCATYGEPDRGNAAHINAYAVT